MVPPPQEGRPGHHLLPLRPQGRHLRLPRLGCRLPVLRPRHLVALKAVTAVWKV